MLDLRNVIWVMTVYHAMTARRTQLVSWRLVMMLVEQRLLDVLLMTLVVKLWLSPAALCWAPVMSCAMPVLMTLWTLTSKLSNFYCHFSGFWKVSDLTGHVNMLTIWHFLLHHLNNVKTAPLSTLTAGCTILTYIYTFVHETMRTTFYTASLSCFF